MSCAGGVGLPENVSQPDKEEEMSKLNLRRTAASERKPEGATVSVKYRGYWYYIDQTDMHTKLSYHMVRILWSVTIAAATNQKAVPILTIPVGR